jgi:hypothetical protein
MTSGLNLLSASFAPERLLSDTTSKPLPPFTSNKFSRMLRLSSPNPSAVSLCSSSAYPISATLMSSFILLYPFVIIAINFPFSKRYLASHSTNGVLPVPPADKFPTDITIALSLNDLNQLKS